MHINTNIKLLKILKFQILNVKFRILTYTYPKLLKMIRSDKLATTF